EEVESNRNILDVEQVVTQLFDVVFQRYAVAPLHLRPSGSARLYIPALLVERDPTGEFCLHLVSERARPDQIHVTDQNVVKLRKLIDPHSANPAAHARDSIVFL